MFEKIFKRKKWQTIYFTQNVDEYYKIKGRLMNNNIEAKTNNISGGFSGRDSNTHGGGYSSYEILVKEDDVHIANEIIHNLK